jgi:hypothetical protein
VSLLPRLLIHPRPLLLPRLLHLLHLALTTPYYHLLLLMHLPLLCSRFSR